VKSFLYFAPHLFAPFLYIMISISNLYIQYGDRILFDSISTTINIGEKIGLTGEMAPASQPLLKILAGEITRYEGVIDKPKSEISGLSPSRY
jgi:ATP-binding cassette subfamily F protein 3